MFKALECCVTFVDAIRAKLFDYRWECRHTVDLQWGVELVLTLLRPALRLPSL